MKRLLCIVSQPPYRNTHSLELLETAMVGAVFDFQVSLLFRDAGVLALLKQQESAPLGLRTISKVLTALPTYEVHSVYACAPSLSRYRLDDANRIEAEAIGYMAQATLLSAQDIVIGAQS